TSFPLGATTVTCTANDIAKNSATCTTTVTVVDTTAPRVSCVPIPAYATRYAHHHDYEHHHHDASGYYKVSASDTCSAATMTFGGVPLKNGETIKITRRHGKPGVTLEKRMGRPGIKHVRGGPGGAHSGGKGGGRHFSGRPRPAAAGAAGSEPQTQRWSPPLSRRRSDGDEPGLSRRARHASALTRHAVCPDSWP